MTWREVLEIHGSRRGIRIDQTHASILLDFGLSMYNNRREAGFLYYEGEGKLGDQIPTKGNLGLLECLEFKRRVLVLERLKPGVWRDTGEHLVLGVEYLKAEAQQRMVFVFKLQPCPDFKFEILPSGHCY
jgi:hypothetical protein